MGRLVFATAMHWLLLSSCLPLSPLSPVSPRSLLSTLFLSFLAFHCSACPLPLSSTSLLSLFCSTLFYSSSPAHLFSTAPFPTPCPCLPSSLLRFFTSFALPHFYTRTILCTFSPLLLLSSSLVLFIPSYRLQSSSLLSHIPFSSSSPFFALYFPSTA